MAPGGDVDRIESRCSTLDVSAVEHPAVGDYSHGSTLLEGWAGAASAWAPGAVSAATFEEQDRGMFPRISLYGASKVPMLWDKARLAASESLTLAAPHRSSARLTNVRIAKP